MRMHASCFGLSWCFFADFVALEGGWGGRAAPPPMASGCDMWNPSDHSLLYCLSVFLSFLVLQLS